MTASATNAELLRALAVLAEPPLAEHRAVAEAMEMQPPVLLEQWRADYTEALMLGLYPYASVYLGPEGMLGGEARDRIAGFWRVLGTGPAKEPDYLPVMLAGYARLIDSVSGDQRWANARRAYFHEHLASWLPPWLEAMTRQAPPFYADWARVLQAVLADEASRLPAAEGAAMHLREAPRLEVPEDDEPNPFAAALLAPAVSGILLTRHDLRRAARDLGMGLRVGERRFMLTALLEQSPRDCLTWLADEARRWRESCSNWSGLAPATAEHWAARATRTRHVLQDLAQASSQAASLPEESS